MTRPTHDIQSLVETFVVGLPSGAIISACLQYLRYVRQVDHGWSHRTCIDMRRAIARCRRAADISVIAHVFDYVLV